MELDLSKVDFSRKDIKLNIKIPKKLTKKLVYFIGIHVGDGTLSFNKSKHNYIIGYTGHFIDEYSFHQETLIPLIKYLFNKDVQIKKDLRKNRNSVRTYLKSKAIFTFLSHTIGLTVGSKKNSGVPKIIKKSNKNIKAHFLRGLADTDFSLTFKNKSKNSHSYPTISFSSASKTLVKETNKFLLEQSFSTCYLSTRRKYYSKRNIYYIGSDIDINGRSNLDLWMRKIGFTSPKHITKYLVWKKYGFCPPYTNINQRIAILNGKLDIYSLYK